MVVIEEKNNIEDALTGLHYQGQKSKPYRNKLFRNQFLVPTLWSMLGLYILFGNRMSSVPVWIPFSILGFSAIWIIFYPYRFKKLQLNHYRKFLKNKKESIGDSYTDTFTFILEEERITIKSHGATSSFEPKLIEKLVELETHLILTLKGAGIITFNKSSNNYPAFKGYFDSLEINQIQDLNWKF